MIGLFVTAVIGCNSILGINEPIVNTTSGGVNGTCTVLPQSGCAESQTCVPLTTTTTGCLTAGSNPEGSPCEDESLCEPGLKCHIGVCRRICDPAGDCADPAAICLQFRVAQGDELVDVPNIGTCVVSCALDSTTDCGGYPGSGPVAGCSIVGDNTTNCIKRQREPDHNCWQAAIDEVGDGHIGDILCNPQTVCTPFGCNRPCLVGDDSACTSQCLRFPTPQLINGEESGYCD